MKTSLPPKAPNSRIEREIQREREQRQKNGDEKSGTGPAADSRIKDARESSDSGYLHRARTRFT
jgi:hypothetical protein